MVACQYASPLSCSGYILDLLEGGRKLIVFGHHKAVLDAISESLDSKVVISDLSQAYSLMHSLDIILRKCSLVPRPSPHVQKKNYSKRGEAWSILSRAQPQGRCQVDISNSNT